VKREAGFENPPASEVCDVLARVSAIAVVGLSPHPHRPSHRVTAAMQREGFRIIPVHPNVAEVLGAKAYGALADVTEPYDLVNVFRAADRIDGIVEDCIRLGVKFLWIQQGIVNEAAAARAVAHGIWTVMDRCIWSDYNSSCGRRRERA
jgi:predicted CoA-binding protein